MSRDAVVRILKDRLDAYLKSANNENGLEDINYNFLEKAFYDKGGDPFELIDIKEI